MAHKSLTEDSSFLNRIKHNYKINRPTDGPNFFTMCRLIEVLIVLAEFIIETDREKFLWRDDYTVIIEVLESTVFVARFEIASLSRKRNVGGFEEGIQKLQIFD